MARMPIESDQTFGEALTSLRRMQQSPPNEPAMILRVIDLSRGYLPPLLLRAVTSRTEPTDRPRLHDTAVQEMGPLFRKAQELALLWGAGRIGKSVFSAENETATLMRRFVSEGSAALNQVHAGLIDWLHGDRPGVDASAAWQQMWRESQDLFGAPKKPWLIRFLQDLDHHGLVGDSVLDIGSGRVAVSDYLRSSTRRIVQIDYGGSEPKRHALGIKLDIEDEEAFNRELDRIQRYVGKASFRTIIYSQVLNYVDFRTVLRRFKQLAAPGGRIVISNQPFEGDSELFSAMGVSDNSELLRFLPETGFVIEFLQAAPWIHVNEFDLDLRAKSLLVVARNSSA
jgi:hypothetical protein